HSVAGRFPQADTEAQHAMLLAQEAEDVLAGPCSLNDRAIIFTYQGRYEDAQDYLYRAIEGFRADHNQPSEASALCNLSRVHSALGQYDSAIELAEQGVAIYRDMGRALRLANGKYTLGSALVH